MCVQQTVLGLDVARLKIEFGPPTLIYIAYHMFIFFKRNLARGII